MSFLKLFTSVASSLLLLEVSSLPWQSPRFTCTYSWCVCCCLFVLVIVKGDSEWVTVILDILAKITDPHLMMGIVHKYTAYTIALSRALVLLVL